MNQALQNIDDRDYLKIPPHSTEAEQSVLGGLMLNSDAFDDVADLITVDDFYRQEHRNIYTAIRALINEEQPVDAITVAERMPMPDLPYLSQLVQSTPSAANIKGYAKIVSERSKLRTVIADCTNVIDDAFKHQSADELMERLAKTLTHIQTPDSKAEAMKDILVDCVDNLDMRFHSDSPITGIPTGYDSLDRELSGMHGGDLIIVAGRPSMGKTSLAMNIAENVALKEKQHAVVFSMEMPKTQLGDRLLSSVGKVPMQNIRTGKLTDEEWPKLTGAVSKLSEAKITIDDQGALTAEQIRARVRKLDRDQGVGVVVIDYLQLMTLPGNGNKADRIGEASAAMKALAKDLNIPIILLSQLNRSLENRPNKRPVMSDLRDSGAIEQDADVILFVYRDEVYNDDTTEKGIAEIIIAKQRNGPIGDVKLSFRGQYCRFENFTVQWAAP